MFERYKVKKDDSLNMIAKNYGTSQEYLRSINDICFLDNLREGMDLIVPKSREQYYDVVKVKKGGSIEKIAREYNINPKLFQSMNGLDEDDYIYDSQEILIPKKNYSYYITSAGDTITSVAKIFDISRDRLYSQNETIYLLPEQIIVNKKISR